MTEKQDIQTQAVQASEAILEAIASLELAPGETFTERELAALVGLGKVPVREGLLRLAWTGLLFPRTGSGYTIAPISLRAVRDVFAALKVIEPAAITLAQQGTAVADHVQQLRKTIAEDKSTPARDELLMHLSVVALSTNTHFLRSHPGVELARLVNLTGRLGDPVTCSAQTHDQLLTLIGDGDPSAAEISRQNLEVLERRLLDALLSAEALQFVNLGSS